MDSCSCNNEPRITKIFIGETEVKGIDFTDPKGWKAVDVITEEDGVISGPISYEGVFKFPVEDENQKKMLDYINDPNNKRIIDSDTGNIYHFVSGELMGNVNNGEDGY